MSKQKSRGRGSAVRQEGQDPSLRLAVAAATLGMTLGIPPASVLAAAAPEPTPLERSYVDLDAPRGDDGAQKQKPVQVPRRVGKPDVAGHETEKPTAVFPKVEMLKETDSAEKRPGAQQHKVRKPAVAGHKAERPVGAFPKVEKPGAAHLKFDDVQGESEK